MKIMRSILALHVVTLGCAATPKPTQGSSLASVTIGAPNMSEFTPGKDYDEVHFWSKADTASSFGTATVIKVTATTPAQDKTLAFKPGSYKFKMELVKHGPTAAADIQIAGTIAGNGKCDVVSKAIAKGSSNIIAIKLCPLAKNTPATPVAGKQADVPDENVSIETTIASGAPVDISGESPGVGSVSPQSLTAAMTALTALNTQIAQSAPNTSLVSDQTKAVASLSVLNQANNEANRGAFCADFNALSTDFNSVSSAFSASTKAPMQLNLNQITQPGGVCPL